MPNTPHLKWPFQMGGFNQAQMLFVEQDTPEEVAQCVAFVFSTEPGSLIGAPALGLRDPSFQAGGVTQTEMVNTAERWEPRATLNFTHDVITGIAQEVGVAVS